MNIPPLVRFQNNGDKGKILKARGKKKKKKKGHIQSLRIRIQQTFQKQHWKLRECEKHAFKIQRENDFQFRIIFPLNTNRINNIITIFADNFQISKNKTPMQLFLRKLLEDVHELKREQTSNVEKMASREQVIQDRRGDRIPGMTVKERPRTTAEQ